MAAKSAGSRRRQLSPRRAQRSEMHIFWATLCVILGGLLIVVGAVLALFQLIYGDWDLLVPPGAETDRGALVELVRVALTLAVGVGGAVALVVAYRKQKRAEEDNEPKHARFGNAAAQLGSEQAAVRLAGVYAMANLADEWPAQRQQCVDVLCAYLRLPWNPDTDPDHLLAAQTIEQTAPDDESGTATTTTYAYPARGGEIEVRKSILRLLAAHLRVDDHIPRGTPSWSDLPLDFTGATLPDLDLRDARLGDGTSFSGVRFSGRAWFEGAQFIGDAVFEGARFIGPAGFKGAQFTGDAVFQGAQFTGPAWFKGAQFTGPAWFTGARFTGTAGFQGAQFTGPAWFTGAQFTGTAWFKGATSTRTLVFDGAQFDSAPVFQSRGVASGVPEDAIYLDEPESWPPGFAERWM